MNVLDRIIAEVSPGWAAKRCAARSVLRHWEAAKTSRLRTIKRARGKIDQDTRGGAKPIREAARWLEQNYDLVAGGLDVLVRNIVGLGIVPEPLVRTRDGELATAINDRIAELHARWALAPEVTGELDLAAVQRLQALTLFRDGECFTQYLDGTVRGLDHGSDIPFSLELIDPDQCPIGQDDARRGIVQGVRKNAWGRPTGYLIAKTDSTGIRVGDSYKLIPADRIQHIKIARRIRQTRGVSVLASVLERLEDIRDYDESERIAAKIAAMMAAYIKRGNSDVYDPSALSRDDDGYIVPREHKFQAGMIFDFLEPGEEVGTIDTQRPNPELGRYRDDQLRAASAGIGCSFSSLARNYEGNYSSRRQEANEMAPQYAVIWDYLVARSVRPTHTRFVDASMLIGALPITRDIDTSTIYDADYSRPATPAIDRQKETGADAEALDTYQDTLVDIWRRNGKNPADMWRKLADQADRIGAIRDAAPNRPTADADDDNDNDNEIEEAA